MNCRKEEREDELGGGWGWGAQNFLLVILPILSAENKAFLPQEESQSRTKISAVL